MGRLASMWRGGGEAPSSALRGAVPEGTRIYAVGDVHGRDDLLAELLRMIGDDCAGYAGRVVLVMMGDYIDRGPDSAAVVERLLAGFDKAWQVVFLRGNHEQAMLNFLGDPKGQPMWLHWGGLEALASYGVQPFGASGMRDVEALAAELELELKERGHADFYAATKMWHREGGYLFVHAGVRPGVAMARQMDDDFLFIREDFLNRPHGLPVRVVFGHTIFERPLVQDDRIGIDTGAFDSGVLTAVVLEGVEVRFLQTA